MSRDKQWQNAWFAWQSADLAAMQAVELEDAFTRCLRSQFFPHQGETQGYDDVIALVRTAPPVWQGRALYLIAWHHFRNGDIGLAMGSLNAAVTHASTRDDPETVRHAWEFLAGVESVLGNHDEAIRCLRKAVQALPQFAHKVENLIGHYVGAYVESRGRQTSDAIEKAEIAFQLGGHVPAPWANYGPMALGMALLADGDAYGAHGIFEGLLCDAEAQGDSFWITRSMAWLAASLFELHDDRAEVYLFSALDGSATTKDVLSVHMCTNRILKLLERQGRSDHAHEIGVMYKDSSKAIDSQQVIRVATRSEDYFLRIFS